MISFIPYIGGKHRIAKRLAVYLHETGADTLVDVFGGSGAVVLNAGFEKRVYNEVDGDLVNLFRVVADCTARHLLLQALRWRPPSRRIYAEDSEKYIRNRFSFSYLTDRVDRAAATFYRHQFAFGGKVRSGGLSVSTTDREGIKEIVRYRNTLRRLVAVGEFFRSTFIEELDFTDCISIYGNKSNVVLFIDPPYVSTEWYYSQGGKFPHYMLAQQLTECHAAVVCTYYDHPMIRELYPEDLWRWESIQATKNSAFRKGNKTVTNEMVLIKRPPARAGHRGMTRMTDETTGILPSAAQCGESVGHRALILNGKNR